MAKQYSVKVEATIHIVVSADDEIDAITKAENLALDGEGVTEALAVDIAEFYKSDQHGGGE